MKRWIHWAVSKKICYFRSFRKKADYLVFAFTYVLETFALLFGNFYMELYV